MRGLAEEVTSEHRDELIERTKASGVEPWAPGHRGHWIRLIPHAISGRRIVPGELPAPGLRARRLSVMAKGKRPVVSGLAVPVAAPSA